NVENLVAEYRLKSALTPPGHPERPKTLIFGASHLFAAYIQGRASVALSEALRYSREALLFHHISPQFDAAARYLHGNCLVERFKLQNHIPELNEAILSLVQALALRPEGNPDRCVTLNSLAGALILRFERLNKMEDLVKAIVYSRGGLTSAPPVLEVQLTAHEHVATSSYLRFELLGQGHDIAHAVETTRRALALTHLSDNYRPWVLEKYIFYLEGHYRHFGQAKDLDEAEVHCREFMRLCPVGHFHHALASQALGCHLLTRFQSHKDAALLEESISLCQTALSLRPSGDINRHAPLKALAIATRLRFELRKENADIKRSILYSKEALELYAVPLLGPSSFLTLGNMLTIYRHRYYRRQDPNDLSEATKCGLEALRMSPQGDPGKFMTLNNLAGIANDCFDYFGKMEHLEEAILYCRQSLSTCSSGHPDKIMPMINLSLMLSARFEILGEESDMEESIQASTTALSLCPSGHPSRERCLRVVVISSRRVWSQTRNIVHLDRAVQHAPDALPLYSAGSFGHPRSREYLGIVLYDLFLETRQPPDLDEAIAMYREALLLCPKDNYDYAMFRGNLAAALSTRYDISNERADLDDAIDPYSRADEVISMENPLKPTLQSGRALACLKIVPMTETIIKSAFALFEKASNNPSASSNTQFDAALRWSLAARAHRHCSTVNAFSRLLALLELRLLTKETVESQQEFLRNIPFRHLSSEAAASAIDGGRLDTAVELLERGRTMLWSRMRGYRHPIHDLRTVNKALADQFQTVSAQLERTSLALEQRSPLFSSAALNQSSASSPIDIRLREYRILSEHWTMILDQIRRLEGLVDFLRTPSFDTLRLVAQYEPVILVNVSELRCDAIIIQSNTHPHLVPLPDASSIFFDHLMTQLQDSLGSEHAQRITGLAIVLRELWRAVVHPIVDKLISLGIELKSRIWWCPTAQLCALSIHAAGPFTSGQRNLPDLFISSYTPTLTSLITARGGGLSTSSSAPNILVIGQPETLPMVEQEIWEVQRVGNSVDVLLGPAATVDTVVSNLRTHSWTHFACHGSRHPEPFRSAFELYNGDRITIVFLNAVHPCPRAEFPFLSACHTAAPDIGTPDKFITLAAALQFAGFRGVVSTFWEMADEDGPETSHDFYAHMFRPETTADCREAAVALNLATRLMRKRNVPLHRWMNFIHIGI
ncbi:CHAT domain-containing protein, partial [Mycena capillaripes]